METKPYLIALDLDGTLLKDDKTISTHTLDVIQKVKDSGHHVCISTGHFVPALLIISNYSLIHPL